MRFNKKDIDITYVLLILIVFTLPLFTVLNSLFIILLTLWSIVLIGQNRKSMNLKVNGPPVFIFSMLFILYFLAFLKDGVFTYGYILEKKMSLLVLPFSVAICSRTINQSKFINVLIAFCLSVALACLLSFNNRWDLLISGPSVDTSDVLIIHRPYFGLYAFFAVLCLIYIIPYFKKKWKKILSLISIVFFIYFSFLIYAKMAMLAFLGCIILSGICWLIIERKYLLTAVISFASIGVLIISFFIYPVFPEMIGKVFRAEPFDIDQNWIYFLSMNLRFAIWDCSWFVLNSDYNWLLGAGLGQQQLLDSCYATQSIWIKYSVDPTFLEGFIYNAHNEFLHTWLDLGIIGPAVLIFIGYYSIKKSIEYKNVFYLSFLLLFFFCNLTESMLSSQKGIVLYSFFNSLIFCFARKNSESKSLS